MYKFLSWYEFRSFCKNDAQLWLDNGYTADELTSEDILNEYPEDYFCDEYQEPSGTERSFTPAEFAQQTLDYIKEGEEI